MSVSTRHLSLCVLVIQTTAMVLLLRYSRISSEKGQHYLASTAVVLSECLKMLICVVVIFVQTGFSVGHLYRVLREEVWYKPVETAKLMVPSCLYTVQNNLLFLALSNLDAATYQVTYQMKILTTALFSVLMLGRKLTPMKWFSLLILVAGVALVQMQKNSQSEKKSDGNPLVGLAAVTCACFSSGFAGVYFEKILKGSSQSLWIRNVQLALTAISVGLVAVFVTDGQKVITDGFFQGYNKITWAVIALQAFGGLVVAVVVKYADNILKGFATTLSIVLSTLLSAFVLKEFTPSGFFYIGSTAVIGATLLYGLDWHPKPLS